MKFLKNIHFLSVNLYMKLVKYGEIQRYILYCMYSKEYTLN